MLYYFCFIGHYKRLLPLVISKYLWQWSYNLIGHEDLPKHTVLTLFTTALFTTALVLLFEMTVWEDQFFVHNCYILSTFVSTGHVSILEWLLMLSTVSEINNTLVTGGKNSRISYYLIFFIFLLYVRLHSPHSPSERTNEATWYVIHALNERTIEDLKTTCSGLWIRVCTWVATY